MKMAFFLRRGVVIVLSLVAGRAGAQIDSNARVVVHSSILCGSCNVQIVAVNETPPYTETDTIYQSGNACLGSDTSFLAMGFSIDTNRKKFMASRSVKWPTIQIQVFLVLMGRPTFLTYCMFISIAFPIAILLAALLHKGYSLVTSKIP